MSATFSESQIARISQQVCRKCGGRMIESKAIQETYTGIPDFHGGEVCTVSPGGPGRLIDCLKCEVCGFSVTA